MDNGPGRGLENIQHHAPFDPDDRYPGEAMVDAEPDHPLDSSDAAELLNKIREWWDQSRYLQTENRAEMAVDCDFYDGLQWDDEDVLELGERGQAPYVFNLTKQSIDWIIGTEKRTRVDHKIHARSNEKEARDDAASKTKVLKYLDDVNDAAQHRSRAFADAAKAGVGWLEDGARNDESDETIFSRSESWRNIWYDALSVAPDLSDARFLFRARWLDVDYMVAMFPDREKEIQAAADVQQTIAGDDETDDFWYARMLTDNGTDNIVRRGWVDENGGMLSRRERVRPIECWYRMPARVKKMRGFDPALDGRLFDENDPAHAQAASEEIVSLYDAIVMEMWCAIFVGNTLLQNIKSPYKHREFPFTPVWGYRRSRDNAPYGPIRNIRDPQVDMNKRASKSLFILSTNQVLAEESAIEAGKWDETVEAASQPNGVIKLRNGALSGGKFQIMRDNQLAEEHLMLMDRDQAMIRNASGVQGENLGADTNAISGKAILAKQNEGSVTTFELFDNLRYAIKQQGRKRLSLVEQFMDMPKVVRVTGERDKVDYVSINEPEWDPVSGEYVFKNDMTRFQADFVIDQQDFRATIRQAMHEQLMDTISKLDPSIALQLMDLVIDMSELPEKDELVSRIRKINGQLDPEDEATPEQVAEQQEKAQKAKQLEDLQLRDMLSTILEREAKTEKVKTETQNTAIEAGTALAEVPAAAGPADQMLASAGFEDADIPQVEAAPVPQPQPQPEVATNGLG